MSRKNKNPKSNQGKKPVVRTSVPAGQLARLIAKSHEHTANVIASRVQYPDPDAFDGLDLPQLEQHGFIGKTNRVGLGGLLQARGGRGKGKGGGGKKLPNPQVVLAEVQRLLANVPLVGNEGPAVLDELNFEFLEASKAKYFIDSYKEIIPRAHIHFCVEVAAAGLNVLSAAMPDYTAYTSAENTRGQAVGFLVHKRFKVIGKPISYDDVATVQGIPDLRPAFRLDLEDTVTGDKFSVVVVHLKSMRGGPATTAPVRYQQCVIIAKKLGKSFVGVVAGDWNTLIGKTTDCDPLIQAGFSLVDPGDSRATHIMGGRLDAFFQLNVPGLASVTLISWFATLKRDLTDHAMLLLKKSKAGK